MNARWTSTGGNGSCLTECVDYVAREEGTAAAEQPLIRRLVGIDDDPFCVSCSLPRVFKNNNARMAVVYLVRGVPARARRKVLLAEVREHWTDAEGQQQATDVFGEMEEVVSRFSGGK